jgi:hypothetical protein
MRGAAERQRKPNGFSEGGRYASKEEGFFEGEEEGPGKEEVGSEEEEVSYRNLESVSFQAIH